MYLVNRARTLPAASKAVARTTYRLPYFWSDMSIEQLGPRITYRSERRWP